MYDIMFDIYINNKQYNIFVFTVYICSAVVVLCAHLIMYFVKFIQLTARAGSYNMRPWMM